VKPTGRQVVFAIVAVLLLAGFIEIVLNLLALASPQVAGLLASPWHASTPAPIVPDERLKYRPNPAYPGHDTHGFRNPEVPPSADVIALGDSQTYGTGVADTKSWPRQLESMSGKTVYSMAYGGYGPVHSLILWEEALALKPAIIIEALYAGNDLYDAFNLVYNNGQQVALKTTDPRLQQRVREAEALEPVAERVVRISKMGAGGNPAARKTLATGGMLSRHSRVYGLLRRLRYELGRRIPDSRDTWDEARAFAATHADYTQIFDNGRFRTVFTAEYRLAALDREDPRITEGRGIVLRAIQRMHRQATDGNIRFIVLFIPTKELVFEELWTTPTPSYRALVENESLFWKMAGDSLERQGIEYIDALPVLRKLLASGIQPYQATHDGHPNGDGHRAISRQIAVYLMQPHLDKNLSHDSAREPR
jgi:hypothetical protein